MQIGGGEIVNNLISSMDSPKGVEMGKIRRHKQGDTMSSTEATTGDRNERQGKLCRRHRKPEDQLCPTPHGFNEPAWQCSRHRQERGVVVKEHASHAVDGVKHRIDSLKEKGADSVEAVEEGVQRASVDGGRWWRLGLVCAWQAPVAQVIGKLVAK